MFFNKLIIAQRLGKALIVTSSPAFCISRKQMIAIDNRCHD